MSWAYLAEPTASPSQQSAETDGEAAWTSAGCAVRPGDAPWTRPPTLADAVQALEAAVDHAVAVDLTAEGDAGLGELSLRLRTAAIRLAALDAAVLARFEASGQWGRDGARTLAAWLRVRAHCSDGETFRRRSLARLAEAHPDMAARLAAGDVSPDHLRVLADAHSAWPAIRPHLTACEDVIADAATWKTPTQLRRFLRALALEVDPDSVDAVDEKDLLDRARLSVVQHSDGWVSVSALLPPDLGTRLVACLRAAGLAGPREDEDVNPGGRDDSDGSTEVDRHAPVTVDPPGEDADCDPTADDVASEQPEDRLACQKRLVALASLLDFAESGIRRGRQLPTVDGFRPVVHVTVPVETFLAAKGSTGAASATLTGPGGRGGLPVSAEVARRLACDGAVRRLLIDPDGLPVAVGRATRTIPTALRVAVVTRDRHCRWPGCGDPIHEVHHAVAWAHGGRTDLHNCLGLCWHHHHVIHHDGWQLTGDANRTITITHARRSGAALTSRPPGSTPVLPIRLRT